MNIDFCGFYKLLSEKVFQKQVFAETDMKKWLCIECIGNNHMVWNVNAVFGGVVGGIEINLDIALKIGLFSYIFSYYNNFNMHRL